jgi:Lon protease-like protein
LETVFSEEYENRRTEFEGQCFTATKADDVADSNEAVMPVFYLDPMLPRQTMQLNIFEHRYLLMISRCLEGSRHFGMVGFSIANRDNRRSDDLETRYGVEVEIVESQPQASGTIHIQVKAKRRFQIQGDTWTQDGYAMANVKWLSLPTPQPSTTNTPTPIYNDTSDDSSASSALDQQPDLMCTRESNEENHTSTNDNESDQTDDSNHYVKVLKMAQKLEPLVEEWKSLVIAEGWQRYHGQLAQTLSTIGPMPNAQDLAGAVDRALWVGALINPLPGLGVAPEIRPHILEASFSTEDNYIPLMQIVTHGIQQSIDYLTPNAVLRWTQYQLKIVIGKVIRRPSSLTGQPPPLPGTHQLVNFIMRLVLVSLVFSFFWSQILKVSFGISVTVENVEL